MEQPALIKVLTGRVVRVRPSFDAPAVFRAFAEAVEERLYPEPGGPKVRVPAAENGHPSDGFFGPGSGFRPGVGTGPRSGR